MVALKSFIPLVRFSSGDTVAYDGNWLLFAVERAVRRSGRHPWPLAEEFVAGITLYLKHCCLKTVIDLPELELAVQRSLNQVGYGDIASHFRSN